MAGKKIFKGIAVALTAAASIILVLAIALHLILTPQNLHQIVNKYSTELLNAQVKTDTIELHIFRHFPRITLSIKNGEVISHSLDSLKANHSLRIPPKADTLLKFKAFDVSISLLGLLSSDINIRRASIVSPEVYAYIAPDGRANFDILKGESTTTEDTVQQSSPSMSITMNNLSIKDNGRILFRSSPDTLLASVSVKNLYLRGNFSTNLKEFAFNRARISKFSVGIFKGTFQNDSLHNAAGKFTLDSLDILNRKDGHFKIAALSHTNLRMDNTVLAKDFPFEINGGIVFDTTQALRGTLNDFTLSIAKIPVIFNGDFDVTPDSLYTNNICGRIDNMSIAEVMKYIPDAVLAGKDKIRTNAAISLDVDVNGSYNFKTGDIPSITAQFNIPKSYVEFEGRTSRINELESSIKAYYPATNKDSAAVEVEKFVVKGRGINLALNGKISDIASNNPYIDINFMGGANLDTLSTLFPAKEGSFFSGTANTDISVKSRLSNLNMYQIGNANIKGSLSTEQIKVVIPSQDLYAILSGIDVKIGSTSNTRDASIKKGMKMLATNTTADSIYFKYTDEHMFAATMLRLVGHHSAEGLVQDSTNRRVLPLNGTLSAQNLYLKGVDSASLRMRDPQIKFSILPYQEDYTIPALNLKTHVTRLFARDITNRVSINNGNISIEAILNNKETKERKQRMNRMLDSLQNIYPEIGRDSLFAHHRTIRMKSDKSKKQNDFAAEDMDFRVDRSLGNIIRQWNISGSINAERSRITTPYLPLRTRLENINFNFTTDKIEFNNTKVRSGESQFILTGKASGLKNAMLRNMPVDLEGNIVSDTLNFNELLSAISSGMEFMNASDALKDSLSTISDEEILQEAITKNASDSLESQLLVVPANIRAKLGLNVKHGIYSKLEMQKMDGELLIKERCLQINGFKALTNAGDMHLTAFYATRNKEDLSTGFDLELKNLAIEKLIELMPAVDTLLPMLKSFEGLVNCQLAATSKMDTTMTLVLPTIRGVARITGENLVLMDGETFSTIAKKLKFKNREKNYIDRISVELFLNDNKIEVFPFIAEMDRYKFAISGTQGLDMSFIYNISILQSPIPFRVGVKIFGNTDDFDFKIGKAKYKSDKLPVFSAVIDSTRINLREHISNIFKIGIDAAINNAPDIDNLQRQKKEFDETYTQKLDTLSSAETAQYESIVPTPNETLTNN